MRDYFAKLLWPVVAGILAGILILNFHHSDQELSANTKDGYHAAVAIAAPSVVNIYSEKLITRTINPFIEQLLKNNSIPQSNARRRVEQSLGSGVIMSSNGHILTNHHVISEASAIRILLHDGRETNAMVVGSDPRSDLAVLKIDVPDLQAAKVADSNKVNVGEIVLAIGNPLGIGQSATLGIISGIGRYFFTPNAYEDFIQTDAIIHQGSSGGALVNTKGLLIGINALTYSPSRKNSKINSANGFGLVTPINMAMFVLQEIITYGEVRRGWLGVTVEPAHTSSNKDLRPNSLLVQHVSSGGPADLAGLRLGDLIIAIDNKRVDDGRSTMLKISMLKPGEEINISLLRNTKLLNLSAVLGEMN